MRNYLPLVLFVFIANISVGQVNHQDVIYLRNGSIIRGVIVEQVPNKSIKIETADKSLFIYQIDEIERITKENLIKNSNEPRQKKGFIGHSFGAAVPARDFTAGRTKAGVQLGLINLGYLFSKNVGISAKLFGASNSTGDTGMMSYGAFLIGPLLSIQPSEKVQTDLRPMIGYSYTNFNYYRMQQEIFSFAFSVGIQNRFHINNTLSLLVGVDSYFSRHATSEEFREPRIGILSPELGILFRLR